MSTQIPRDRPIDLLTRLLGQEKAKSILDALAASGWACVPVEPTEAMVQAAYWSAHEENADGVWREMVDEALR